MTGEGDEKELNEAIKTAGKMSKDSEEDAECTANSFFGTIILRAITVPAALMGVAKAITML